ncbi:FAD-binding protein [Paraflavisolibacter sp. H34]|uniref:FAD-binding protein n=1 Tax=Huijunlia imazamoxiresistens TaxID=3127457 RepID=UPI003018B921
MHHRTSEAGGPLKNWAGNLTYSTRNVAYPRSVEEVREVVSRSRKLRVLGSRHSFNPVADSTEQLVSLQALDRVVALDTAAHTLTVEAGARYGDFAPFLHQQGYALPNLASLPHITVVGACATATHGSGVRNGSLASAVSALELVTAQGEVVRLSREKDGERFLGAVVHLGGLGVVTKVTLDLEPSFDLRQLVYLDLPMAALKDQFGALQEEGYSVSLFTDWKKENIGEVWIKKRAGGPDTPAPELLGARLALETMHPIAGESAVNVTEQLGIPGPWYERLPHFKMGFKPSAGAELQSEYFVPLEHAYEAMRAIAQLQELLAPHLFISEVRTIAADDYWLSPFYKQPSAAFHFTWKQHIGAVMALLPLVEQQLAPFRPRPHWGKLFTLSPSLVQSRYERLPDFKELAHAYDPTGKFRNDFLERYIFS